MRRKVSLLVVSVVLAVCGFAGHLSSSSSPKANAATQCGDALIDLANLPATDCTGGGQPWNFYHGDQTVRINEDGLTVTGVSANPVVALIFETDVQPLNVTFDNVTIHRDSINTTNILRANNNASITITLVGTNNIINDSGMAFWELTFVNTTTTFTGNGTLNISGGPAFYLQGGGQITKDPSTTINATNRDGSSCSDITSFVTSCTSASPSPSPSPTTSAPPAGGSGSSSGNGGESSDASDEVRAASWQTKPVDELTAETEKLTLKFAPQFALSQTKLYLKSEPISLGQVQIDQNSKVTLTFDHQITSTGQHTIVAADLEGHVIGTAPVVLNENGNVDVEKTSTVWATRSLAAPDAKIAKTTGIGGVSLMVFLALSVVGVTAFRLRKNCNRPR